MENPEQKLTFYKLVQKLKRFFLITLDIFYLQQQFYKNMSIRSIVMKEIVNQTRHFFRLPQVFFSQLLNPLTNFAHLRTHPFNYPSGHFKLPFIKIGKIIYI
jgi:hypothetical protein